MDELFDAQEAARLAEEAKAVEDEFIDLPEWGLKVEAEIEDSKLANDEEAWDRAVEEAQRLAAVCRRRANLWQTMASGMDFEDLSVVRANADAIRQVAADEFRRSWEGGGAC